MNDLFIQPPQFEKVAYKRVSENPSEWTANVMEAFYNQFPSFSNSKVSVSFSQKDEAKGYAIGHIAIEEGTGMIVPIIIKDRELFPFDVAIVGGNTMPLTNATIQLYIQNRGAFWKLVKPDAGDITNALFNTSFSQSITPTYMHETYKQASVEIYPGQKEYEEKHPEAKNPRNAYPIKMSLKDRIEFALKHPEKKAEYENVESADEQAKRVMLHDKLADPMGKCTPQDSTLKKMEEEAIMGGQMKANEIFTQLLRSYQIRETEPLLYMMLSFKKWATEEGLKTSGWDIPGMPKTASVADWFFDKEVNDLAGYTGITRTKLNELKKGDPERFAKLHMAATKIKAAGGDVRAAIALHMPTQQESGKVDENPQPALGLAAMSKQGEALLTKIASTITQEMKDEFFTTLQEDPSVVEGFKRNGTANLVLKLAAVAPKTVDFKEQIRADLDRDIHYIYKSGSHEYTGLFSNSKVADTVRLTLTEDVATKLGTLKTSPLAVKEEEKTASTLGYYLSTTNRCYGILPNDTYTEIPDTKIASIKGSSDLTPFMTEPTVTKSAAFSIPNTGITDVFEVTRVWQDGNREMIETATPLEKRAYSRMSGIDAPYVDGNITYLPKDTKFIKLGEYVELPERLLTDPVAQHTIVKTADNQYELRGSAFAQVTMPYDIHNTTWTLVQAGVREEDIEKVSSLRVGDSLTLSYDLRVPHSLDKIASIMEKEYSNEAGVVTEIAKNLIKEAATLEDQQTVDSVLALNFVNKNNILEFVESLPMFAQVAQKLSDMLLKTRLGVSVIEEAAIRRTMLGIVDVMDVLSGIQNLLEKK